MYVFSAIPLSHLLLHTFFIHSTSFFFRHLYSQRDLDWNCNFGFYSAQLLCWFFFALRTNSSFSSLSLSLNPSFPNCCLSGWIGRCCQVDGPSPQWLWPWHCVSLTLTNLWAQWLHSQPSSLPQPSLSAREYRGWGGGGGGGERDWKYVCESGNIHEKSVRYGDSASIVNHMNPNVPKWNKTPDISDIFRKNQLMTKI